MAENNIKARILIRQATSTEWASSTATPLRSGEFALDTTTGVLKIATADNQSFADAKIISLNGHIHDDRYWSLLGGTQIPVGTDLNTLTTVGNYYFPISSEVPTLTNKPENVSVAFLLKIYQPTGTGYYRQQELLEFSTYKVYKRYCITTKLD